MAIENNYSMKSIRNGLIAGYSAGVVGIVVGHPLDSIKVLLQTQNYGLAKSAAGSASSASISTNTRNADTAITRASKSSTNSSLHVSATSGSKANVSTTAASSPTNSILGTRSLRALYAGMAGPLLASGAIRSVNFAVYDSIRRILYQHQLSDHSHEQKLNEYLYHDRLGNVAVASFTSGAATSIFTSPMALVKTKQQIMVWSFPKAISDTFSNSNQKGNLFRGIQNFYTGFGVHFFCDAVGTAVYFTSYEYFKREIARRKSNLHDTRIEDGLGINHSDITLMDRMVCAASAGMVCWSVIFPWDVIRSRLFSQAINNETSLNGFQLAKKMVKEQGFSSLYRGVGITVARAGPVAAAVLPVYDCVLSWLLSSS